MKRLKSILTEDKLKHIVFSSVIATVLSLFSPLVGGCWDNTGFTGLEEIHPHPKSAEEDYSANRV